MPTLSKLVEAKEADTPAAPADQSVSVQLNAVVQFKNAMSYPNEHPIRWAWLCRHEKEIGWTGDFVRNVTAMISRGQQPSEKQEKIIDEGIKKDEAAAQRTTPNRITAKPDSRKDPSRELTPQEMYINNCDWLQRIRNAHLFHDLNVKYGTPDFVAVNKITGKDEAGKQNEWFTPVERDKRDADAAAFADKLMKCPRRIKFDTAESKRACHSEAGTAYITEQMWRHFVRHGTFDITKFSAPPASHSWTNFLEY
jgi:hypothetical protein